MAAVLKNADVRFRVEADLKAQATDVLQACGLNVSDALRLFLRQVVETQGLPFEVRVPSKKTARAMKEARAIRHQFDSMDEMLKDLDGEAAEKDESEARRPA